MLKPLPQSKDPVLKDFTIRHAVDSDADAIIRIVNACFKLYEDQGVYLDMDNLDADLVALRSKYEKLGGEIWVAEDDKAIAGLVGYTPEGDGKIELKRLYVDPNLHGSKLGMRLLAMVEEAAIRRGDSEIYLWSDTRFTRAHKFYERAGYLRQAETRFLYDLSKTEEYCFIKRFS